MKKILIFFYFSLMHCSNIFPGGTVSKPRTIKNAIEENKLEEIQEFVKNGLSLEDQHVALYLAISKKNKKVIQILLDAGVSPNKSDMQGITPLHSAAKEGCAEIIDLLLSYGAYPKNSSTGHTPFYESIMYSQLACIQFFVTTPLPEYNFSFPNTFKSPQQIKDSYGRIKTFLSCLERNNPDFPKDLKFQILSWMPGEIFSQTMLRVMLKKHPSDFEVYMHNCPQKWLIPATKNLGQEKIYEEILTNHMVAYANKLCSKKMKGNKNYSVKPYDFAAVSEKANKDPLVKKEILQLLDPQDDTARRELIQSHIQKLKKLKNE